MKLVRYALLLMVCLAVFSSLSADCELKRRDFEIVEEYLNSKRTMPLNEKACNLTISGDVRFKYRHESRRFRHRDDDDFAVLVPETPLQRCNAEPRGKNHFEAVFDLYLDYVADCAWGVAWIQMNNSAGMEKNGSPCCVKVDDVVVKRDKGQCGGSGECADLCLRKAYMGYNLCASGCTRIDIELGRRPLWTVFDSRIQFGSRFDGLLLRYSTGFDYWGDFYANLGGFVVDDRVEHFSFVGEMGLLNIADLGFDVKYSFIYWPGKNKCNKHNARGFQYENSQVTVYYNFNPELLCVPAQLYGAVLYNSKARDQSRHFVREQNRLNTLVHHRNHKDVGLGWYVGFIVGEVRQEGDWSIDIDYEYVQPFAVMNCDVSSDNACGNVCSGALNENRLSPFTANYRGWRFEGLYAVTDNLVLDTIIEGSRAVNRRLEGRCSQTRFRLEALYAF